MTDEIVVVTVETDAVVTTQTTTLVSTAIETVEIAMQGPPGIQGIPGGPAGAATAIEGERFAYNEVSPILYLSVPANKLVLECRVIIETPFNGVGATLSIGDSANPESLLSITQNNPFEVGGYYTTPLKSYLVDTELQLFMNPGTDPSQGSGRFFILVEG